MNDRPNFPHEPAGDGELLSAYLDGELDEREATALEERLEADPALAEQLEHTREVVEALAGLRATPPEGFGDRLRARLAAERGVTPLDAAARRPGAGRPRWASLGAVAAAGVAVAVLGAFALTSVLPVGDEMAMETADDPEAAMEPFAERDMALDDADDGVAEGFAAEDEPAEEAAEPAEGPAAAGVPAEPEIVEAGAELAGDDEARAHLRGLDDAAAFLGVPHDEATQLAAAFTVALRHAAEFSTGVAPDRCLEVLDGEGRVAVPVRVERVTYGGEESLAYLVASATEAGAPLDRIEGWIVDASSCATRLYSDVSPAP